MSPAWQKRYQLEEGLSPRKRIHTVLTTYQATRQDETDIRTMTGQWWAGPHLDRGYLDVYVLGPLFKF